jgi:hypothetical protein
LSDLSERSSRKRVEKALSDFKDRFTHPNRVHGRGNIIHKNYMKRKRG